jgi:hypothetical protein
MASPGLDEITTTTLRNRKMGKDKAGAKDALKVAQSGTPVPAGDASSKSTKDKAAKGSGGSLSKVQSLPQPTATDTPVGKDKWEGSAKDWQSDYAGAKRKGISTADYEDTASDRLADNAGQRRMESEDGTKAETHPSGYRQGVSAFSNTPKVSHGFGHPASARDGHLRCSGHSGAHQIGKKK